MNRFSWFTVLRCCKQDGNKHTITIIDMLTTDFKSVGQEVLRSLI